MNITFIGIGYVGLVSGMMMSHLGHQITCLDTDAGKIAKLIKGILPIYEPGLSEYLLPLMESNKIRFTDQYSDKLYTADAVFITVGTPPLPSGAADLRYVFEAIDNVSKWARDDCLLV